MTPNDAAPPSVQWTRIPAASIKPNPKNPRVVRDKAFAALVASIKSFPAMLDIRPIVVNGEGVILGGNARLQAAIAAGLTEVPVVYARGLSPEQEREFVVKDNLHAGEWDFGRFLDPTAWTIDEVKGWGLDLPFFGPEDEPNAKGRKVSRGDMAAAEAGIGAGFDDRKVLQPVTCPHCAQDFAVEVKSRG